MPGKGQKLHEGKMDQDAHGENHHFQKAQRGPLAEICVVVIDSCTGNDREGELVRRCR